MKEETKNHIKKTRAAVEEAAQKVYDCSLAVARGVIENAQETIEESRIEEAKKALDFLRGIVKGKKGGLKKLQALIDEVEKSIESIRASKEVGYQKPIYVMPISEVLCGDGIEGEIEGITMDDTAQVLALRNLYRQARINRGQYEGGLATLVAAGVISKSEFTRLKNS